VNIFNILKTKAASLMSAMREWFDMRDFLVYGGLLSLGYGFHQLYPWLGWVSFGLVAMLLGLGWLFRIPK
jgi:hypothetical protein